MRRLLAVVLGLGAVLAGCGDQHPRDPGFRAWYADHHVAHVRITKASQLHEGYWDVGASLTTTPSTTAVRRALTGLCRYAVASHPLTLALRTSPAARRTPRAEGPPARQPVSRRAATDPIRRDVVTRS